MGESCDLIVVLASHIHIAPTINMKLMLNVAPSHSLNNHGGIAGAYSSDCSLNRIRNGSHAASNESDPLLLSRESVVSWAPESDPEQEQPAFFSISIPRISLARLSIFFLAFATMFDMALTKMSNIQGVGRPRASLGSAAISSLTDTLSPILPFAGGLDLRRGDYWSVSADGNWFGTLQSVVLQVQDAFAKNDKVGDAKNVLQIPLGGSRVLNRDNSASRSQSAKKFELVISVPKPFVGVEVISQLTLGDLGQCFQYAVASSQSDFNVARFLAGASPSLRAAVVAMQEVVARSHGNDFSHWIRPDDMNMENGAIDVLKFAAAMRVFAEWRVLRQVPPGNKGFAMGMSLGHKDVVQNIVKIEEAAHGWLDHRRDACAGSDATCGAELHTPTLRELLEYELETGVQPTNRLPYLTEKSAGMGLLWVRRQFAYQTQIFDNVMAMEDGSGAKSRMKDAVSAAYTQVYGQYHGWAVQKIFNYSFQAAPEAEEILRFMNPHRLRELLREQHYSNGNNELSDASPSSVADENPVLQLLNHIGGEWDKLAFNVVRLFNKDAQPPSFAKAHDGGNARQNTSSLNEEYVTREMVKDAHAQIASYLVVAKPVLGSIAILFDSLNMDDPTRV
jgi:Glycolipid transfer protein (GLTP)